MTTTGSRHPGGPFSRKPRRMPQPPLRRPWRLASLALLAATCIAAPRLGAQSVAHVWNEALLDAIREDFARPTVHARNLFHLSVAMYDAWAAYDEQATPLFLGDTLGGYACPFDGVPAPADVEAARREAISHAAYRLLRYRFRNSPGRSTTWFRLDSVMFTLGYDASDNSTDYASGSPAALGNYLGSELILFGMGDGSNDAADYANAYYQPLNGPLIMDAPGNPDIVDPNRWQPLSLSVFIDQSGNPIPGGRQEFLGPEWGNVVPFALSADDLTVYTRDSSDYWVYHDPGPPPYITDPATREDYQRGFETVALWSGLLDPADDATWDISPGARGRHADPLPLPQGYFDYYDELGGGDTTSGLRVNPYTGQPYAPNVVRRGDYGRVLAEFWADGPDSETPPGHWFTILNYVMEQPSFERRWRGQGPELSELEYAVKAYLALGGAMHDAAVSTWGIKGWYDYLRPVSAIRYMAERGQRSDPGLPNYDPEGLRLIPGFIEQITDASDPLSGDNFEHLGEVKLWAWRGPDFITDPDTSAAGVGWIRAKEWWPYQRPTFVSPPFAGYISGHSCFSRAAAEMLTTMTGSAYFPGGLGTFDAPRNEFLVFEEGPSESVQLQWATYREASDQSSLSRIFGGIHPPADDIPARRNGIVIAADAYRRAAALYDRVRPEVADFVGGDIVLADDLGGEVEVEVTFSEAIDTTATVELAPVPAALALEVRGIAFTSDRTARVTLGVGDEAVNLDTAFVDLLAAQDLYGNAALAQRAGGVAYDTRRPRQASVADLATLTPADVDAGTPVRVTITYDEPMDTAATTVVVPTDLPAGTLSVRSARWADERTLEVTLAASLRPDLVYDDIQLAVLVRDVAGNLPADVRTDALFDIDFRTSGVAYLPDGARVELYPVPLGEQLQLESSRSLTGRLELVAVAGRRVGVWTVTGFGESLDLPDLTPGAYLASLTTEDGERLTWRLVK